MQISTALDQSPDIARLRLSEADPAADPLVWLDALVRQAVTGAAILAHAAEIAPSLRLIEFAHLVGAIERARPGLAANSEVQLYQSWIVAQAGASPLLFAAWFNMGVALGRVGDRANAAVAYRNALTLKPTFYAAAVNLGLALEAMGQTAKALEAWRGAVQPNEDRIALLTQRARLLERLGRLDEAEAVLRELLAIDPAQPDVVHHWIHVRQKTCRWPAVPADLPGAPAEALLGGSGPLGILALTDDVAIQRENARRWVIRKTMPTGVRLSPAEGYRHGRIRVGYLSSDFCRHAMSYLITELFERHDRTKFEVFGYCSSLEDGSDLRRRVIAAFDHHRPIRALSDEEAALAIRNDEIDILIDLNGITDGTRIQALRWKPAPVQATYLGFIGSVPLPELDFLLCDDFVVPPAQRDQYEPTPLCIGDVYQANDTRRLIGQTLSRAEVGLPEDRFVFCCFSNHYKITQEMFSAWLTILAEAPHSVLWLSADNEWSERRLAEAAARAGIDTERLIIAPRVSPEIYMSRLALADLFLDTSPYNAGTIASDAIRMGLPLLTLCGRSFASRMAGSLLTRIGAEEGIALDLPRYVERAVRFANDPQAHRQFKALFSAEAWASGIGDIERFTRQMETVLATLVEGECVAATA